MKQVNRKKIVFVIPNMVGGGTERVISLLSDNYVKRGYEVAIMQFAGYESAYSINAKVDNFSISPQSKGNPLIFIKRIINMRKYFKKNTDCYIFAFCVMGTVFSVVSTLGMKRHLLVAERNDPSAWEMPRLRNWAYRFADAIIYQTEDTFSYYDSKINKLARVIPNPVADDILPRFEGNRKHRVVTVGRLHEQKNQILLLDTFTDFVKKFPDYELHIYGKGKLEQVLKEKAKEFGIDTKVIWHGFSKDVQKEIIDSRMFVLSSNYEGISNSMIEAIAMGVPTIATDCPLHGARCYIENGVNGILIPMQNKQALLEAMCKIAIDDVFTETLSKNGTGIREKYSVDHIATHFLEAAGVEI